jgi:DNA polymerase-1
LALIYDIETDGLLDAVTKVHCIVTRDSESDAVVAYYDHPTLAGTDDIDHGGSIETGLKVLEAAPQRAGQWVIGYDDVVLRKLYPWWKPVGEVWDTVVGARVLWPEEHLKSMDFARIARGIPFPKQLIGRHSLEAWGHRLKHRKGDFGKQTDWKVFNAAMLRYSVQDTLVTRDLYRLIAKEKARGRITTRAWKLEQEFAVILERMQARGIAFNMPAALDLTQRLLKRKAELVVELQAIYPPFEDAYETPKRKERKVRRTAFNPGSRVHIARVLTERFGWKPKKKAPDGKSGFREDGRPRVDEDILKPLKFPGVPLLIEYLLIDKRLGSLAEGKESWIKNVKDDDRIHGRINHNAAVTGRCTHSKPNVTGVPKVKSPYGRECRALFTARPGYELVGADASGGELRLLGHHLAEWDGGAYAKVATEGDVHSENTKAAGLKDREVGKRWAYALLYGAGDTKLGLVIGGSRKEGLASRAAFDRNVPAMPKLKAAIGRQIRATGTLVAPDGRHLHVRSEHAALNTLLQGGLAVVMKLAVVLFHRRLGEEGLVEGVDFGMVLMAHDEVQVEVKEGLGERVGKIIVDCIAEAGRKLGIKAPLTGAYKVGRNWAETH